MRDRRSKPGKAAQTENSLTPTGPAKRGGHKRSIDVREVLTGIFYVL